MKDLKDYGHIHIDAEDKEYGMIMPCVVENGNKHELIDDWADLTGEEDKLLGVFDTAFEAVKVGIKMIKQKFPNAKIMYGAGQPPSEWIDNILKSEPQTTSPSDSKTQLKMNSKEILEKVGLFLVGTQVGIFLLALFLFFDWVKCP